MSEVPPSDLFSKTSDIRAALVGFSPFYKGPGRSMLIAIWVLCGPAILSLISLLVLGTLAGIMRLLSTTVGSVGDLFYLPAVLWLLAIPCACVGTVVLTLPFSSKKLPTKVMWGGFIAVAINWTAIGLAYLLRSWLLFLQSRHPSSTSH
jgi:hypothetical protein